MMVLRSRAQSNGDVDVVDRALTRDPLLHQLVPVADYKLSLQGPGAVMPENHRLHGTQVRCRLVGCPHKTCFCCVTCSDKQKAAWGVCSPATLRECAAKHQKEMLLQ